MRVGVEDPHQVPALLVHLVEDVELFLRIQAISDGARVAVRHREEPDGAALLAREQAARLVGEPREAVRHHLVEEHTLELHLQMQQPYQPGRIP